MSELDKNAAFDDIDALFDASMDDIADLPPMGVPPTGHYNLDVTFERDAVNEKDAIIASYTVIAINEVSDDGEAAQVAVGQSFRETFIPKKQDGTANTFAIAALKARILPFAQHFGIDPASRGAMGETIRKIQKVAIIAVVKRLPNKNNPEFPRMKLEDVVVL